MRIIGILAVLLSGLWAVDEVGAQRLFSFVQRHVVGSLVGNSPPGAPPANRPLSYFCPPILIDGKLRVGCEGLPVDAAPAIDGYCDTVSLTGSTIEITGWAIDASHKAKAALVAVSVRGRVRGSVVPGIDRPDVADAQHLTTPVMAGFTISVPIDAPSAPSALDVKVFGITTDGHASPLKCERAIAGQG